MNTKSRGNVDPNRHALGISMKWIIAAIWLSLVVIGIGRIVNEELYAITSYGAFGRVILHTQVAVIVLLAIARGLACKYAVNRPNHYVQFIDMTGRIVIHSLLAYVILFISFDILRGV